MRRMYWLYGCVALALTVGPRATDAVEIGGGARYFRTIDELDGPFEENGLAPLVTVRGELAELLHLQADFVLYPDGYAGSDKDVFAPELFLLLGKGVYAGLGAGALVSDGEVGDPFFIARAGINLELLPAVVLDINANYEFAEWEQINTIDEDADSDTITLGAALRLDL